MGWLRKRRQGARGEGGAGNGAGGETAGSEAAVDLENLRRRFDGFRALVESNNRVLSVIGDMEEKAQGDFLFDIVYVRRSIETLRDGIGDIIERIIDLGGEPYETLRARAQAIWNQIDGLLPGGRDVLPGPFVLEFARIGRVHSASVGGKNAQLGELRALGLNIPDGFAITTHAFQHVLAENRLADRIHETLTELDIRDQEDLERASATLRERILTAPIPEDLADAVREAYGELTGDAGPEPVALRSSAVGEDTLFSFAGQYSSFLNVPPGEILDRYRQILASKYSPRAIYYFLSHSLEEANLSMSVGCTRMVDAAVSGVIYTRDPLDPEDAVIQVHAIYGLGPYLVGGVLTPDVYRISRDSNEILERAVHEKGVQLKLDAGNGTREMPVPEELRGRPCLDDRQLVELARIATRIEDHYQHPQDVEWAIDGTGAIYMLQTRPLRTICAQPSFELPDMSDHELLAEGGTTICPGAGCGEVAHVSGEADLAPVRHGSVVVAANPFPALAQVLDRAAAVVTEVGSSASHMATLVRERRLPTIVGLVQARKRLPAGTEVTVDASGTRVYAGCNTELMQARRPEYDLFQDTAIFDLLRRLLALISPLHLVNPRDPEFRPERCRTLHDITRFAHQRGIEEVFAYARSLGRRQDLGVRLKTALPFPVMILNLDEETGHARTKPYDDQSIPSAPMRAFWDGLLAEKWPFAYPEPARLRVDRRSDQGLPGEAQFTESSFAVVRREYMLANLYLGYHFTSVEAVLSDDAARNLIRVHYKGGGAADKRRRRRIGLLEELLDRMGFEHTVKSDYIDCRATGMEREPAELNINRVGRLVMLTKQLDMALSNDRITRWYIEDFARKLELDRSKVFPL